MSKLNWVRSLRVGDVVEDCRYENVKITEIYPDYGPIMKNPINYIVLVWLNYFKLFWPFTDWYDTKMRTRRIRFFSHMYDAHLTLENGNGCSAMHCCDKVAQ